MQQGTQPISRHHGSPLPDSDISCCRHACRDIYQTARLITDRDLQLLRRFDKKEPAYQAKLLEEVSPPCCPAALPAFMDSPLPPPLLPPLTAPPLYLPPCSRAHPIWRPS